MSLMLHEMLVGSQVTLGPPPTSAVFLTSVSVDGPSIVVPATVQNGDIAVLWDAIADMTFTQLDTVITGWDRVVNEYSALNSGAGGGTQQQQVYVKILTSADAGTSVFGSNLDTRVGVRRKLMVIFRGSSPVNGYSFGGLTFDWNIATPVPQTIMSSSQTGLVLTLGMYRSQAANAGRTFTPTATGSVASGTTAIFDYLVSTSAPPNVSLTMADSGNLNFLGGFYLKLF